MTGFRRRNKAVKRLRSKSRGGAGEEVVTVKVAQQHFTLEELLPVDSHIVHSQNQFMCLTLA